MNRQTMLETVRTLTQAFNVPVNEEQLVMRTAAFSYVCDRFDDVAITDALREWVDTMTRMPSPMEFAEVVRKHHHAMQPQRAIEGGTMPLLKPPVGKSGSEGIATAIVIQRMMRAVAELNPQGFFGRVRYGWDERHAVLQEFEGRESRAEAYATIAFEQAVEFVDSDLTWEVWDGVARGDVVVLCRNPECDHGWVEVLSIEHNREVVRVRKCDQCGGPKLSARHG